MPITQKDARALCTADEFEIVAASFSPAVRELDEKQLRALLTRARRMSDKWRDLGRQQKGEARGKRVARKSKPASGAAGTARKAKLFTETVERIEKRLGRLAEEGEAARKREPAQEKAPRGIGARRAKKARGAKTGAKKAGGRKAGGKTPGRDQGEARRTKTLAGPSRSVRGHQRVSARRGQARRDSR